MFDRGSINPGNWDVDVLTLLVGLAFGVALIGLWSSLVISGGEE